MLIEQVFEEYQRTRNANLSQEEFAEMLCLIPILLVAVSDQNVDSIEMGYLTGLVHELVLIRSSNGEKDDTLQRLKQVYMAELNYLIRNMRYWEDKLLNATHQLLERDEKLRRQVLLRMRAVAESSSGVNSYEQAKIGILFERLGLKS